MQLHRNSSQIKLAGSKKSCLHVADASGMNLEALTRERTRARIRTLAAATPRVIWGHALNSYASPMAAEP